MRGSSASSSTARPCPPSTVPQGDVRAPPRVGPRQQTPRPSLLHTERRDRSKALAPPELVVLPPLDSRKEPLVTRRSPHSSPPFPSLPRVRLRPMRGEKNPEPFQALQSRLPFLPRLIAAHLRGQV